MHRPWPPLLKGEELGATNGGGNLRSSGFAWRLPFFAPPIRRGRQPWYTCCWPPVRSARPNTGRSRAAWCGVMTKSRGQGAGRQGQVRRKDSDCLCDLADHSRASWSSTPRPRAFAYGIAYLVRPKGDSTEQVKKLLAKSPTVELDQKNCEFQPYVLPFHKDQKLVIKSSDPIGHNVRFTRLQQHRRQHDGCAERRVQGARSMGENAADGASL